MAKRVIVILTEQQAETTLKALKYYNPSDLIYHGLDLSIIDRVIAKLKRKLHGI